MLLYALAELGYNHGNFRLTLGLEMVIWENPVKELVVRVQNVEVNKDEAVGNGFAGWNDVGFWWLCG
jgi:hypothetical protein